MIPLDQLVGPELAWLEDKVQISTDWVMFDLT